MRSLAGMAALSLLISAMILSAAETPQNALTEAERAAGWTLLFDGQTAEHWRNYRRDELSGKGWQVEDGCLKLRANGQEGGDICSRAMYAEFEFSVDIYLTPGANSGVMYHVDGETNPCWQSGPEVAVQGETPDARGKHSFGALYDMVAPNENKLLKPQGEWNTLGIRLEGGVGRHYVNGLEVCQYPLAGAEWDAMVAASKFRDMPRFGKSPRGYLCIQDHGNQLWYRNMKIRVITPATQ